MTKLDVLDGLDTIRICVGLSVRGETLPSRRCSRDAYAESSRCTKRCRAGRTAPSACATDDALPLNARRYLERIEALVGVPLDLISTGPDRDQTIVLRHPFDS